ncbi:MAG: SCO family protein, partial [Lentisphaeraceae bacterium]|nr:SCO family protein [Lentisphaeraceae bacterium]
QPGDHAIDTPDKYTQGIDVIESPGSQVPLDVAVTDETGAKKTLGDYFNGEKPAILCLVYYNCKSTCGPLTNYVYKKIQEMPIKPIKDYNVIFLSFDPTETADLAAANKKSYLKEYGMEAAAEGHHFLTTDIDNIKRVTTALGFEYRPIGEKDFSHPTVTYILTKDGKISRYLYGFSYFTQDIKFSLMDASEGKIGTAMEKILLLCFSFDPQNHRYVRNSMMLMSIAGALTLLCLGTFLGVLWYKEFKNKQNI